MRTESTRWRRCSSGSTSPTGSRSRRDPSLEITGFPDDTLVRDALLALAEAAGVEPHWTVEIEKRIPVGSGLGGGSSDAAAALRLANETLPTPLAIERLHEIAAGIGADVPFFLTEGPQLGTGDGSELEPLDLPDDYRVVLVLPAGGEEAVDGGGLRGVRRRRRIRRAAGRAP